MLDSRSDQQGVVNMGSFKFKVDRANKTINIELKDKFSEKDAKEYVAEYLKQTGAVNTGEYSLIFDCTRLEIGDKDSLRDLEACFGLYAKGGYPSVVAILNRPQKIVKGQFEEYAKKQACHNFRVELK